MNLKYICNDNNYTDSYFIGSKIKDLKIMLNDIDINFTKIIFYFDDDMKVLFNKNNKTLEIFLFCNINNTFNYKIKINESLFNFMDLIDKLNYFQLNNKRYNYNHFKIFFHENINDDYNY